MESILKVVRAEILRHFGKAIHDDPDRARRIIESSTFLASEDPGQWAPRATVVIHCEDGIPNGSFEGPEILERWQLVSRALPGHFIEHINSAVIGVYEE